MTRVARAVEKGETQGFMRILVDGDSKEILGASLLGTGCDEAVHAILDLMYAKAPYTVMQRAMHIHPTVSELLPTILGDLKSGRLSRAGPRQKYAGASLSFNRSRPMAVTTPGRLKLRRQGCRR